MTVVKPLSYLTLMSLMTFTFLSLTCGHVKYIAEDFGLPMINSIDVHSLGKTFM